MIKQPSPPSAVEPQTKKIKDAARAEALRKNLVRRKTGQANTDAHKPRDGD